MSEPRERKPRKPLVRKRPLRSRSSGMKRGGKLAVAGIKRRKRRPSDFARIYGSVERVRWIKSLSCAGCGMNGPSDNAHTGKKPGVGLKADASTIVPLCRRCHSAYDEHRHPWDKPEARAYLANMAPKIEAAWQQHLTSRPRRAA